MTRRPWLLLPLLLCLSGCPGEYPTYAPTPYSSPGTLSDLVQQSQSENSQLSQNLNTPLTLNFPVHLGVLFYQYDTVLQPEDQQTLMDTLEGDLVATPGLVRSMVVVPSTLVSSDSNLDDIRNLVSRFRVDTLLIVSGNDSFDRTGASAGLFGQFSNSGNYEARTDLTALGMDVLTGRFLAPINAADREGPQSLNPDDTSFNDSAYKLKKAAATKALTRVEQTLKQELQAVAQPNGTPSASATAPVTPVATPSPVPTPTPSASAS
ncbi:MAG TPA: hypothetical protein V6D47_20005 [Oscillatoriaceae cyanobacterium]